ncbi:hypothetical protein GUITHDRAFT_69665 [Guillardia theta CCMP2712]|uniref:Metallo-beta-lactamase domain-containing protein n=1 Tax=Guillardia theta (strain CCMP2712) TaxID=905079 RepID=L1JGU0_GUITC|nr:hypothetical protein GUITHDRAFT_69665 [Guillardia theta CCMP2712]EKX47349.1 hypothetical protein GUITHDRAFT_69665 [Guillardia theta CCMP2712]|eukprot:XP_005834329.1 hypothetical protein GUITHDRAFT_69665 [Guillardia theta CCMP2712]
MQVTWIGHSTVLAQYDGWNVLTDPIFSERCSPSQWVGPRRYRRVPIQIQQLPPIHVVLISHNHYDHLDLQSVKELSQHSPSCLWVVPLGMKPWFDDLRVSRVVELDWSEEVFVRDRLDPGKQALRLVSIPCQHWCARGIFDRNKCLWSSWYSTTNRSSLFFAGDTGFSPIFTRAGKLLGPVDVALLPIGAYGGEDESWFHRPNHMEPEEAVQAHDDLLSRLSVAIHWGTFQLTSEPVMQPKERLMAALRRRDKRQDEFVCLEHGQTIRASTSSK